MQLVSSPRNGSDAGDNLTVKVDNATTSCASSSQTTNAKKELPMGYIRGICVGEGLPPVPEACSTNQKGEFIEMCELIPEYWLAKEDDGTPKIERH